MYGSRRPDEDSIGEGSSLSVLRGGITQRSVRQEFGDELLDMEACGGVLLKRDITYIKETSLIFLMGTA